MDMNAAVTGLCERCTQRPSGVEGHDHLVQPEPLVDDGVPGVTPFKCALCQAVWGRGYAGGGQFVWLFRRYGEGVDSRP